MQVRGSASRALLRLVTCAPDLLQRCGHVHVSWHRVGDRVHDCGE